MADENTPQEPAVEQEQPGVEQPETGEPVKAESKTVPLADLVKERKERQRIARELEEIRTANLSDTEKAIAEATKKGETAALMRVGQRLVDAEVKAAAAGRLDTEQVAALLDGLDRTRFLSEDGEVDADAVATWVGRFTPATRRPVGDVGQGPRDTPSAPSDPKTLADAAVAKRGY